jgi:hypothetical protein
MSKELFMKIVQGVREYDDYFKYKKAWEPTQKFRLPIVRSIF